MMAKKKSDNCPKQQLRGRSNKECINYGKKRHYTKDCYLASKKKSEDEKAT